MSQQMVIVSFFTWTLPAVYIFIKVNMTLFLLLDCGRKNKKDKKKPLGATKSKIVSKTGPPPPVPPVPASLMPPSAGAKSSQATPIAPSVAKEEKPAKKETSVQEKSKVSNSESEIQ